MARRLAIAQSEFPYHITGRCINKDWFSKDLKSTWEVFCEELWMAEALHSLKIHSFVLMSNHFHLIVSTPEENISTAMKRFMEMTSKRITKSTGRINQTFGGRHYKTILQSDAYFANCYKYVYFNPIKSELAKNVEDYPFSSLRDRLGLSSCGIPLAEDPFSEPEFIENTLTWLNTKPTEAQWTSIGCGLRKNWFQHGKVKSGNAKLMSDLEIM